MAAGDTLQAQASGVRILFTWWGTRKSLTDSEKDKAAQPFNASGKAMSAYKHLVDSKHPAILNLTEVRGKIRRYWKDATLPYVEKTIRLIKHSDIDNFTLAMKQFQKELTDAEDKLNSCFTEIRTDAMEKLGTMFNHSDYPPHVTGLFTVVFDFPNLSPPDYLMKINPALYEQEKKRIQAKFDEAAVLAEQAFAVDLERMVARLADALKPGEDGKKKVFKDSTVDNLKDFFLKFKHLSIGSNAQLEDVVTNAQKLLCDVQPGALRNDVVTQANLGAELDKIGGVLAGMIIEKPKRLINKEDDDGDGPDSSV